MGFIVDIGPHAPINRDDSGNLDHLVETTKAGCPTLSDLVHLSAFADQLVSGKSAFPDLLRL